MGEYKDTSKRKSSRRMSSVIIAAFILMVAICSLFMGNLYGHILIELKDINAYEQNMIDKNLEECIDTQYKLADAINKSWRYYNKNIDIEDNLDGFVNIAIKNYIAIFPREAFFIFDNNGKLLYNGYNNSIFFRVHEILSNANGLDQDKQIMEIDSSGEEKKDKIHLKRIILRDLRGKQKDIKLFVAFSENIAKDTLINTLDRDSIDKLKYYITNILVITSMLMIICFALSLYMVYYNKLFEDKLYIKSIETKIKNACSINIPGKEKNGGE